MVQTLPKQLTSGALKQVNIALLLGSLEGRYHSKAPTLHLLYALAEGTGNAVVEKSMTELFEQNGSLIQLFM